MSELCLSSTSKTRLFFCLLKSDLFLFCSSILSHPLYFLYFIFFSPYLLKLVSFLSPLFVTTSLLLLALLTLSPNLIQGNFAKESSSSSKVSFLITAYRAVVEKLRSKVDDHNEELLCFEDFEMLKIVFDTPIIHDAKGSQVEVLDPAISLEAPNFACLNGALAGRLDVENSGEGRAEQQANWAEAEMEEKRLEEFLQQLDKFDESVMITTSVEEEKIEPPSTKAHCAVEKEEENSMVRNGSEAAGDRKSQKTTEVGSHKGRHNPERAKVHSHQRAGDVNFFDTEENNFKVESSRALDYINLGSYGSMRKEKDWKRTLACKLFEERRNADGGEGMDLLWETYETESNKTKPKGDLKKKNKKKHYEVHASEVDEDEDDGGDESNGQLCCLQALKFSTGKMNLGMGKPSLVRISKAIKGIGWLHHVSRHSKKVHNGDRF